MLSRAARCAPIVLLLPLLGLTGCDPSAIGSSAAEPSGNTETSATGSVHAIPVGAGPQSHYTVQAQPAPGSCRYRYEHKEPLPDAVCTPGALSPKVTQATIGSTICRTGGYTSGIRPSSYVTGKEKAANAKSYAYTGTMRDGEYDHLLSGVATSDAVVWAVQSIGGMELRVGRRL